jgi:hypothetical protein
MLHDAELRVALLVSISCIPRACGVVFGLHMRKGGFRVVPACDQ